MAAELINDEGIIYEDYFDEILWNVQPVYIKKDPPKLSDGTPYKSYGEVVQLQWGWTANMDQDYIDSLADDCPRGYEHVTIDIDCAISLYKQLGKLLRKHKKIHRSRQLLIENANLRFLVNQLIENNPNPNAPFQAAADCAGDI